MSLALIEIIDDTAVIDSRRYCAEVIEVNHDDWFRDTLLKYKTEIEQRFGIFRFETGKINGRGRPEKFAYLTEGQTNALLVFSRNTAKVRQKKLDLIEEFESNKNIIRQQLERQLVASMLTASDVPGYPHTAKELWQHSGIVHRQQVFKAITRDFVEGKHYHWEGKELQISQQCYLILMLAFRSKSGHTVDVRSQFRFVDWGEYYEYESRKKAKANTRLGKGRREAPGQMKLDI